MNNIVLRCECDKCGIFVARSVFEKEYKIGDIFPHKHCCGTAKVIMIEEMCSPKDCKESDSIHLYPSRECYKTEMTDKEIGKTAREIAERGNTAEVKRNKEGIVILEVGKKIVRKDNVSTNQEL